MLEPPNFLVGSGRRRGPRSPALPCQERKLRRAQRRLSRAQQGCRNREKARRRVAKIQERTANLRQEFLRQLSSLVDLTWSVRAEGLRIVAEGHPETVNAWGLRGSLAEASIAGGSRKKLLRLQAGSVNYTDPAGSRARRR